MVDPLATMYEGNDLKEFKAAIGATDEEAAAKAGMSKNTLRRALEGDAPKRTIRCATEALEALRRERIDRLTKLKVRTAI